MRTDAQHTALLHSFTLAAILPHTCKHPTNSKAVFRHPVNLDFDSTRIQVDALDHELLG